MNLFNSPDARVSLGGLLIGLGILTWYGARWWRKGSKGKSKKGDGVEAGGNRDWRELLPLAYGLAFGSACIACVGGILGWAAYSISNINAAVGDKALAGTTGAQSQNMPTTEVTYLTGGGAVILVLGLVVLVALWKKIPKRTRVELAAGTWAGASLALSAGAAGVLGRAIWPLLNSLGDPLVGAL